MSNKKSEIGKSAQNVVFSFFEKFKLKYTNSDIARTMKNVKDLFNAGYTEDELLKIIEYAFNNQPPEGIYSFGYIIYIKDKALNEIKVNEARLKRDERVQQSNIVVTKIEGLEKLSNADKIRRNKNKSKYDSSIFKK